MFGFQAYPVPPTTITRLVFRKVPTFRCLMGAETGDGTPVAAARKLYRLAASE